MHCFNTDMETVCLFTKMDIFPLSKMKPLTVDGRLLPARFGDIKQCQESERPLRNGSPLKRQAVTNNNQCSGVLSPIKQLRMDNSHESSVNKCKPESSRVESKLKVNSSNSEISLSDLRSQKNLIPKGQMPNLDLKELCLKRMLQTSVLHKSTIDLNQMLEQSRQKLYRSIDDDFDNCVDKCERNIILYDTDANDSDITKQRCRSSPNSLSTMTNNISHNLPEENIIGKEISSIKSPLSTTNTSIHTLPSDDYRKVDECDDDVNNIEDERDDLESCSSTPSSGFIDIEADTPHCSPPSSPLNLSTHNESMAIHDTMSQAALMVHSHVCAHSFQCASKAASPEDRKIDICEEKVSQNFRSTEKKTNFSIDAILRPDFGSSNSVTNDSKNVNHCQSGLETSCPVSPSAFTAVDLSIKSRAESLSSPCSSSSSRSSPSSPLSSSSPLSLRRNWEKGHELYTEHYTREREIYHQRLFPNPNKNVEMFMSGQFPFVNPAIHGIGKVPFSRTFPAHVTSPPFIGDLTHPRNYCFVPNVMNPKGERLLQKDISKLINWSVQNHLTNKSQSQLVSHKQSVSPRQPMTIPVLKHIPSNQNTQLSEHATLRPKRDPVKTNDTGRPSQNSSNIQTKEKKRDLKQDKQIDKVSDKNAEQDKGENPLWPAWVFCTRYSDRPSSGPRSRKQKRNKAQEEKRPRTAFTNEQLQRLKREFEDCRYLTEIRRKNLADELGLTESQIKIWFQNKRAKIKKSVGVRNPLALQLMEQGLYNHSTVKDFLNQEMASETTSDAGEESS